MSAFDGPCSLFWLTQKFPTDDWFNNPEQNKFLPYLYDGVGNAEQGQIASTRMALETPVGLYVGEHSH